MTDNRLIYLTDRLTRSSREVTNYFAGLRYVGKNVSVEKIRHEHLFDLHRILAGEVIDQGEARKRPGNII